MSSAGEPFTSLMRVLYVHCGLVPPPEDERLDKFSFLSEAMEGDVLLPVWWKSEQEALERMGPASFPVHRVKRFRYHVYPAGLSGDLRQKVRTFRFLVATGIRLYRERRFDCIVTYGHTLTALAGVILKVVTGARLIVEINSEPAKAVILQDPAAHKQARWQQLLGILALHFAVLCADRVRLLHPDQIRSYPLLRMAPTTVLHDFAAVSLLQPSDSKRPFILLVGYPWYLKGVDILIGAFRIIAAEFPGLALKVVGYIPDRRPLEPLIGDCPRIELLGPLPAAETMHLIAEATILAHPARTEAMGRVLLEAMSARTAIVASSVGGIPYYVRDGHSGMLCPAEDVNGLASRLRALLADCCLRERLEENAFNDVHTKLNEQCYVQGFHRMIMSTLERAS